MQLAGEAMNVQERTRISLCQFLLKLFDASDVVLLLAKHELGPEFEWPDDQQLLASELRNSIMRSDAAKLGGLVQEIARTRKTMRNEVHPRYRFDDLWKELCLCLELDGYALEKDEYDREIGGFVPIEPKLPGTTAPIDDLARELHRSMLSDVEPIVDLLEKSARAFLDEQYNASLSNARVALETLADSIATSRHESDDVPFDARKWGEVVRYLRKAKFIDDNEEKGIAGVYSLISPGSHTPLGFTKREFARFGRGLAVSTCYFLAKRLNGHAG